MFEFSYIIGFKKQDDRIANINCVLDWLKKNRNTTSFEIIVVEQD